MPSKEISAKKLTLLNEACEEFLLKNYSDYLISILQSVDTREFYTIKIDYVTLNEEQPFLAQCLSKHARTVLKIFDKTAIVALKQKYEELNENFSELPTANLYENPDTENPNTSDHQPKPKLNKNLSLKQNVHVRIPLPYKINEFPGNEEIGSFVCLMGTVVKTCQTRFLKYSEKFQCTKCKQSFFVEAEIEQYYNFPSKIDCPNYCLNGKVVSLISENEKMNVKEKDNIGSFAKFREYQEIKLQEHCNELDLGTMPRTIKVILEDDLVDQCKVGDDVSISGSLSIFWEPFCLGQTKEIDLCLIANFIEIYNDQRASVFITDETHQKFILFWEKHKNDPFQARNIIVSSFCPEIYGMYKVKLALCVVLAGGLEKFKDNLRIRGESHILLVGDPGTGKSQFLKYCSRISPRSVLTTGFGTTSAGLTVSAVKEDEKWHLEAGALVLADGGVCCIDEFSCIRENDRIAIHEAMEQQTISVAKAGIISRLQTKCTIIAATNAKGKLDPSLDLSINLAIASPLLSRFDLLIVLQDKQNPEWDNLICDFILSGSDPLKKSKENADESLHLWDSELLQIYLVLIKEKKPIMTPEANLIISTYYKFQRESCEERVSARTTVRLLESLIRLAEGHAKLMFREKITIQDALAAVDLMECSSDSSGSISILNTLLTSFPADPMEEYSNQAKAILDVLKLEDIWRKENSYIEELKFQGKFDKLFNAKVNKRKADE